MLIDTATPTAAIIVIGNEILSGQTQDSNVQYLAGRLQDLGIIVPAAYFVRDIADDIMSTLNRCRRQHTYVFTTGGIGPTHDDITTAAVACALQRPLVCDLQAARALFDYYPDRTALYARMKMTEIPAGAQLIPNSMTIAPGFTLDGVFVLAGIPRIMQVMFEAAVPYLTVGPRRHQSQVTACILEGMIADDLTAIQQDYPNVEIGSYPLYQQPTDQRVRIVIKGYLRQDVANVKQAVMDMFIRHGGKPEAEDKI